VAGVVAARLRAVATYPHVAPAASAQTIRIAIGAPLTGGAATFGVAMRQAVELAADEQNAGGGLLGARVEVRVAVEGERFKEIGEITSDDVPK
jgi:branched-chain amino acid transport system substrate-binding protein